LFYASFLEGMPFTLTKTDEEAENIQQILNEINIKSGSRRDVGPLHLVTTHKGGREYIQGWDDPTMHPVDGIARGGQLLYFQDPVPEHKLAAIAEACKRNDPAAVKSLLGFSRLASGKTTVEVDLGGRCHGQKAIQAFMKALPENLEALSVHLKCNMLMLPGITAVADGLPKNLRSLHVDLTQNKLQAQGVEIFMKAIPSSVTSLTLGCGSMKMGVPGVKVIADNLPPSLTSLYVDLHDGILGDEGVMYLAQRLPKTLTELEIHMRGDQGMLTTKGYWYFDRLINDPLNPDGLPNVEMKNFRIVRNQEYQCVQQYGITEEKRELIQRWPPNENVC
jgi:hypothetical protein